MPKRKMTLEAELAAEAKSIVASASLLIEDTCGIERRTPRDVLARA